MCRFPAGHHSHRPAECFMLVSPPAALAEEVFPRLGCSPGSTAATLTEFVVLSIAEPF